MVSIVALFTVLIFDFEIFRWCGIVFFLILFQVFQRRYDGSEDFYRNWEDYANGFGCPNMEYWLGNIISYLRTYQ